METVEPIEAEAFPIEQNNLLPVPASRGERGLYILIVAVLPIICFLFSDMLKPEWQSGQYSDYMALLLIPQVTWFFFPFLIFSAICLCLLLFAPQRFASRFVIRFGCYTGVLLALQYVVLTVGTGVGWVGGISAGFLIFCNVFIRKIKSVEFWIGVGIFLGTAVLVLTYEKNSLGELPFWIFLALASAAPFLCLSVGLVTAFKLVRNHEARLLSSLWPAAGVIAWLGAYSLAWRFSISQAIQIYHSLPAQPPDCYIATASARGHRRVVNSWPVKLPGGAMWVTRQLQLLKLAELALMALTPRFHRLLRRIYDRIGPPLAHRLNNPILADLAYLTLKPCEWAAVLALKAILPDLDQQAGRLYVAQK